MPRKQPMMASQILGSVLPFAVDRFVQILHDLGSRGFGPLEVTFDILDKNSQALRSEPKFRRSSSAGSGSSEHDPGVAQVHLCPADGATRFAVAIMLAEPERLCQPCASLGHILIKRCAAAKCCSARTDLISPDLPPCEDSKSFRIPNSADLRHNYLPASFEAAQYPGRARTRAPGRFLISTSR
jgi:hypothetical protein